MIEYLTIKNWVVNDIKDIIDTDISITDDTYLNDLELDSLDVVDVVVSAEISINEIREKENKELVDIINNNVISNLCGLLTVKDLVDYIYERYRKYE